MLSYTEMDKHTHLTHVRAHTCIHIHEQIESNAIIIINMDKHGQAS